MNKLKPEWGKYFDYLEELRKSGRTNMYGARPFLMNEFFLDKQKAGKVLQFWMKNYSRLKEERGW